MVEPRAARPTQQFVDEYCQLYAHLFPEVRSFEAFKYLHVGMISDLKRKTLPAIARAVGLGNEQGLHHLLAKAPWTVTRLRWTRLQLILELVNEQNMILLIDETGDCKKGNHTDYVKRQYIGNVGKKENGIVAVTAYGLFKSMILPLSFEVYKPKERLNAGDEYQSKPQIAAKIIRQLQAMGFQIDFYSSLLHHLFEIPVAQSIAAIPAHIQQDDFRQKVPPFEQGSCRHWRKRSQNWACLPYHWLVFATQPHFVYFSLAQLFRKRFYCRCYNLYFWFTRLSLSLKSLSCTNSTH